MAVIAVSLRNQPQLGTLAAHITAHGVREGRYGDLWELSAQLTPPGDDARAALLALAHWLLELLEDSDGCGVPD